jgi:two-component system sensor histidine kinase BaeS
MRPNRQGKRPPPPRDLKGASSPLSGRPLRRPKGASPPTALFDLQGNNLAGIDFSNSERESIDVPVIVDGQPIALLKSEPKRKFDSSIETAFSRQQWITSGVIGIASLLLAALVSWGLVRLLLSPVRRIIDGVNRLSRGDYSQQLLDVENRHDELGQLMDDLNHLTHTLDKNQSSRRRWIADISHELRTPLSVLTGEVEALKDGIRPFNKEQLLSLDQEIKRLRHLTDDLYELSLSDIGGLRYEFTEIDLAASVNQLVKSHQLSSDEQDISMTVAGEAQVMISADANRINQLLANLIRNSLAYTDSPGLLGFDLKLKKDTALLSISDTPPGVTKKECLQLFEPLYRQDASRTRRGAGAGLGLAICQNIVEAHRGTITAKPSAEGGLQIDIELPLAKQETV